MSTRATELVGEVDALLSLPQVYMRIRDLLNDPQSDFRAFADVVSTDPALCARLLRIANSAFFGFATHIESIDRALMIMGTQQLHDLALADATAQMFDDLPLGSFDLDRWWRCSLDCAVTARLLATRLNALDAERYFLLGLLHDIGHLVLVVHCADQMSDIFAEHRLRGESLITLERRKLGYDYAQVGAALLAHWRLPQTIHHVIERHPMGTHADPFALETATLHVAARAAANAAAVEGSAPAEIAPAVWATLSLDASVLEDIAPERAVALDETLGLIRPAA